MSSNSFGSVVFKSKKDSLRDIIQNGLQIDQFKSGLDLFKIFMEANQPDSAREIGFFIHYISKGTDQKIQANRALSSYYDEIEINDSSRYYSQAVVRWAQDGNHPKILAKEFSHIGRSFYVEGVYDSAMVYYYRAMTIYETNKIINSDRGWLLHYIGSVFKRQENNEKACEYYEKELNYAKRYGFQGVYGDALYLNAWCIDEDDPKKALEMRLLSLDIFKSLKNESMQSLLYNLIGASYRDQKDYQKALIYQFKALKIRRKEKDISKIAASLDNIGGVYKSMNQYNLAIQYLEEAEVYAKRTNRKRHIRLRDIYDNLSDTYSEISQYEKAYKYLLLKEAYNDSVVKDSRIQGVEELSAAYESTKKELEIIKLKKNNQLRNIELAQQEVEVERERELNETKTILNFALVGGIVLILVAAGFIFHRLKVSRNQTLVIEDQKKEVDTKNREIIDSIHYAKRIQAAVLPSDSLMKVFLPTGFVFYKPKDIVAGDFYWLQPISREEGVLVAAADCTGHGVPGAMVSVVCNNGLNRAVREFELNDPGKILDKTREIVIQEFEKSDEDVKDGMDIALLKLKYLDDEKSKMELQYAGAHNPLWIIRKGSKEIEITKANKQPIGKYLDPMPYDTHTLELNQGDLIYIFTDGYIDQFGGEKGKKLKPENFKNLLLSIKDKPMNFQRKMLDEAFDRWRNGAEQVDDYNVQCTIDVLMASQDIHLE
jgi:serine phosphatase RsbU (regulator of sigma subunit)